jgi:hypothetical protein
MNVGEVSVSALLEWLQSLSWAVFIHKTPWAFTTIEVVHIFAVSMVLGTIALVDLRLLGLASTKRCFAEFSRQVLPFTWVAFVVAVIAGSLLFISKASEYFANWVFWLKMLLIVLAGINMMIFEFGTVRNVLEWNLGPTPRRARLAGGISIACWIFVVFLGRLIAFTLPTE